MRVAKRSDSTGAQTSHRKLMRDSLARNDFIDAYRGSLVLAALLAHCHQHNNSNIVNLARHYEYTYSTCGLLALSSFLLTYGLLVDHHKTARSLTQSALQTLKYLVRRFFRVYVIYTAAYALALLVAVPLVTQTESPRAIDYNPSWIQVATLNSPGNNVFWPIYSAIRYALFIIPPLCVLVRLTGRFALLLLLGSVFWSLFDFVVAYFRLAQLASYFDLPSSSPSYSSASHADLRPNYQAMFAGSQAALALFLIERNDTLGRCVKYESVQTAFGYVSLALVLLGLESRSASVASCWSTLLLVSVLSQSTSTTLARAFESSGFMKRLGKISFSFYLFGVLVTYVMRSLAARVYLVQLVAVNDLLLGVFVVGVAFLASWLLLARYVEATLDRCARWVCRRIENFQPLLKALNASSSVDSNPLLSSSSSNSLV